MLVEHSHAVVGQALKDMRLRERREKHALAVFAYWSAAGVSVSARKLSSVMMISERTAWRIVASLVKRRAIERNGQGYQLMKKRAA